MTIAEMPVYDKVKDQLEKYGCVQDGLRGRVEVGDVLWVKEEHYVYGWWQEIEGKYTARWLSPRMQFVADPHVANWYFSEDASRIYSPCHRTGAPRWEKRLARFMPKQYCRMFKEITAIRAERLQDITEMDAKQEGATKAPYPFTIVHDRHVEPNIDTSLTYRGGFVSLFDKIHGKSLWLDNPWVWVYTFKNIDKPQNWPACSMK